MLAKLGRSGEARQERLNAIELMEGAEKHRAIGELHLEDGALSEALESFLIAIKEEPNNQLLYSFCVLTRSRLGDVAGALVDANSVVALMPQEAAAFVQRAGLLRSLGRRNEALADYDEAIRLQPDRADFRETRKAILNDESVDDSGTAPVANLFGLMSKSLFGYGRAIRRLIPPHRSGPT